MTVVKLGWTNPLTDAFGAHPTLGAVLDLNDGTSYVLASPDGLELPPPPRTVVQTGNIRTQGERATRAIYRHNREAVLRLVFGPAANYAAFVSSIRSLLSWLDGPPSVPFSVQFQPFGASSPVYLDVVAAAHDIPEDEAQWLRLQFEPLEITLVCRPGLRGDRVVLQNLLANPGFEQGSGPGVGVFADAFTNVAAYAVQAGGAPTTGPAKTYLDVVLADSPLRLYMLSEASGSTAYDVAGNGYNGTLVNSGLTLGAAGGLNGDTSTATTFPDSGTGTGYYSCPMTGLPTGSAAYTIEFWLKFGANPSAAHTLVCWGTGATKGWSALSLNNTGAVQSDKFGFGGVASGALSTGVWHHVAVTWDGTNERLYVDGALVSGPIAQTGYNTSSTACYIGAGVGAGPSNINQSGAVTVQAVAPYAVALSPAQITAHYNAGHTGATGTVANSASFPAASRVALGSSAWGAGGLGLNTWATRLRWQTGLASTHYLHYTDANNYLAVQLSAAANGFALVQYVAGVVTTIQSATVGLTHEAWYWLKVSQFPCPQGGATPDVPYVSATLSYDQNGSVGAQIAAVAGGIVSASVAVAGASQVAAAGAALVLGGKSDGSGHAVSLFGPGGWQFQTAGAGAFAFGAWDPVTTYPSGPVNSNAAARIDIGPGVGADASWRCYLGGAPAGTWAVPVKTAGDVLAISAWTKSASLGVSASTKLTVREYDASGNLLRTDAGWQGGSAPSLSGAQAAWTSLTGTYTTGATCAYLDVALRVVDATNGSAGGIVWFDNCQVWDKTDIASRAPNQTSMPYCELRFPQSPAQLVVSGLLGDLPAPSFLALGTYDANLAAGTVLSFALGRSAKASAAAALTGISNGYYGSAFTPQSVPALDPASYGGFYVSAPVGGGWNPRTFSPKAGDMPGVYHLYARLLSKQAAGNLANVQARMTTVQQGSRWFGKSDFSDYYSTWYGPYVAPFSASNAWTLSDVGQCQLPPYAQGALVDPAQTYLTPRPQMSDSTGGGSQGQANWQALIPVDGSLLLGTMQNPSNTLVTYTGWAFAYVDALGTPNGIPSAATLSVESAPLPNPARGFGGPGTATTGTLNVNLGADPYLTLDPTIAVPQNGQQGVNQMAGFLADQNGAVLPLYAELAYSPLYLYPR